MAHSNLASSLLVNPTLTSGSPVTGTSSPAGLGTSGATNDVRGAVVSTTNVRDAGSESTRLSRTEKTYLRKGGSAFRWGRAS